MIVDCCVILITILFPPAGVFMLTGCGADLCINICLTCLGYFPGHIHAFYIMMTRAARQPGYTTVYAPQQPTGYGGNQQHQQYTPQQPTGYGGNQQQQQSTPHQQFPSPAQQGTSTYYQPPPAQPNTSTKKSDTFSQPPPYS